MTPSVLSRLAIVRRLWGFGLPVMAPLGISLVCRVLAQLLGIGLLVVGVRGLAGIADDPEFNWTPVLWTLVAFSLTKGLLRYLEQFAGHTVAFRVLAMLRVSFYDELVPQSPAGVLSRRSGDLVARATKDVDRVEVFFAHTLVPVTGAVIVPCVALAYMAVAYDPVVAAVALAFFLTALVVVPSWGAAEGERAAARIRLARGRLAQHVTESLQGLREVLTFGAAGRRREQAGKLADEVTSGLDVLGTWTARRRGVNAALFVGALTAVTTVGCLRFDALGLEGVAVCVVLVLGVFPAIIEIEDLVPDLEQAFASARRIWAVTDAAPQTTSPVHPVPVALGQPEIVFENVHFRYPLPPPDADEVLAAEPLSAGSIREPFGPPVLEDITLRLPAGKITAVVGPSGTGKSTLVHLLTRAFDPQSGRVLLGGHDIREHSLAELRRTVSVVTQYTYLFNDTIAANLRLAAPEASDEDLAEACRRVSLHEAIVAKPDGYATVVGEHGDRLSGGQRQRLALARALLRDSPVLVLDEATSQLDATTEARIHDALVETCRDRTVLVITHRRAAMEFADAVVRIEELSPTST